MQNDRLPYHAPELHDHGNFRDITLAGQSGNLDPSDSTLYTGASTPELPPLS